MGLFKTEKVGEVELAFPDYSGSKRFQLNPDILEYNQEDYDPKFDLIIGTETMEKLVIVLNFKQKSIEIDRIDLPMRSIEELQLPNKMY